MSKLGNIAKLPKIDKVHFGYNLNRHEILKKNQCRCVGRYASHDVCPSYIRRPAYKYHRAPPPFLIAAAISHLNCRPIPVEFLHRPQIWLPAG